MLEQWSPWFAWFMDIAKFAITFGVTAAVTLFGINKVQERRARGHHRAEALFQLQMDALLEFRRAAVAYEVAALSAYTDLYQWKGGDKTSTMRGYENTAFGNFEAALDGLEIRFKNSGDTVSKIEKLRTVHKTRHTLYDDLVDTQLDTDEALDLWQDVDAKRDAFGALLGEAKTLRKHIIATVEEDILETA